SNNTSSFCAFIRVAKPTDPPDGPYFLDLDVFVMIPGKDPIDSLQTLFNLWLITGLSTLSTGIPDNFVLYQNYPNPFNPATKIKFDIKKQSDVKILVYDIIGNEI